MAYVLVLQFLELFYQVTAIANQSWMVSCF